MFTLDETDGASVVELSNGFILTQGRFMLKVFQETKETIAQFFIDDKLQMESSGENPQSVVDFIFLNCRDLCTG